MSLLTDIIGAAASMVQSVVKHDMERCIRRLCVWSGFLAVSMLVLLAGIGLIIAGAHILLAAAIGSGLSALIVGVIVSLLAVILVVTVKSYKG